MNKYWKSLNFIKNTCLVDWHMLDKVARQVPVNAKQIEAYTNLKELVDRATPMHPIWHSIGGHNEYICPACQKNRVRPDSFCDRCGQAIADVARSDSK